VIAINIAGIAIKIAGIAVIARHRRDRKSQVSALITDSREPNVPMF